MFEFVHFVNNVPENPSLKILEWFLNEKIEPNKIIKAATNKIVASKFLALKARYEAEATKNASNAYIVEPSGTKTVV